MVEDLKLWYKGLPPFTANTKFVHENENELDTYIRIEPYEVSVKMYLYDDGYDSLVFTYIMPNRDIKALFGVLEHVLKEHNISSKEIDRGITDLIRILQEREIISVYS